MKPIENDFKLHVICDALIFYEIQTIVFQNQTPDPSTSVRAEEEVVNLNWRIEEATNDFYCHSAIWSETRVEEVRCQGHLSPLRTVNHFGEDNP